SREAAYCPSRFWPIAPRQPRLFLITVRSFVRNSSGMRRSASVRSLETFAPLGALARSRSRLHVGAPVSNRRLTSSAFPGRTEPRTTGALLTTEYFRLNALD